MPKNNNRAATNSNSALNMMNIIFYVRFYFHLLRGCCSSCKVYRRSIDHECHDTKEETTPIALSSASFLFFFFLYSSFIHSLAKSQPAARKKQRIKKRGKIGLTCRFISLAFVS